MNVQLGVKLGKLHLDNPVMVASGTFGYTEEFKDFISLKQLGAIVTKTITLQPRQGNPVPRTCETPAGMLNSIGLENPGLDAFIKDKLPALEEIGVPLIVSISLEGDPREFLAMARRLDRIKSVSAIELNISCPNVRARREQLIAQDARATHALVGAVRKVTGKTLITKLSPNVTDITEIAQAAEHAGSDALSLINTLVGMSIDITARRPNLARTTGGLSGPAVKPVALRMVWEVSQKVKIPIIGMGGIMNYQDALEFILAGASAVSIGTANFINPKTTIEIITGIKKYLIKSKTGSIKELIGALECRI